MKRLVLPVMLAVWWGVAAQVVPSPVIDRVSVHPTTGEVTIDWTLGSGGVSVDGFIVFWLRPPSDNYSIDTIRNPAARSYTFAPSGKVLNPPMPDPRLTTVPFTVAAFHNTPWEMSTRSREHYNVQSSCRYDSCRGEITLRWRPYRGWSVAPSYHIKETATGTQVGTATDTSFVIDHIAENVAYSYYVEAIRSGMPAVTGYRTDKFTKMPVSPSYITGEAVQYGADSRAEMVFRVDPATETDNYDLLGSSKPQTDFVSLQSFVEAGGGTINTRDVLPRESVYYYRLAAQHICKDRYTAVSNTVTALWLTVTPTGSDNVLRWDAYQDWGGTVDYKIYRQSGQQPDELLATANDAVPYRDDITTLSPYDDLCYRIEAMPSNGAADRKAVSNQVCLKPESEIYIPEAFTPNGD